MNQIHEVHLIARNEDEVKEISEELDCSYSTADVLEENFIEKIKADTADFNMKGVAYCVGSIDLKPIKRVSESDMHACMKLNLYSAIEVIKGFQEDLKKSTVDQLSYSHRLPPRKVLPTTLLLLLPKLQLKG